MRYLTELRGVSLELAEFRALTMLWTYADKECRNAFPGNARLAADLGITDERRVRRLLQALEAKGYIVATSHAGGRGRATSYALTLPTKGGHGDPGKGGHGDPGLADADPGKGGHGDPGLADADPGKGGHGDPERGVMVTPPPDQDQVYNLRTPVVPSSRAHAPAPAREADQAEPKPKRGTRLPADFIPSEKSRRTILDESPALDLRREHSRFVDYWTAAPGQRGVKLDWNATWRNWMRKAADSQNRGRNGAPTRQQQTDDLFDRAFQRAAAADAADAARATIRGELA